MTIYLCLSRILRALGMSFSFLFPIWPEGATQEWTAAEQLMWNVPTGEVENRYSTIRDAKKNPWFCRTGRVSSKKGVNLRKSYEIVWFVTIPSPQAKVRQSSWILWSCRQQSRRRCHGGWTKTIQSMMQRWWLLEERLESINFMSISILRHVQHGEFCSCTAICRMSWDSLQGEFVLTTSQCGCELQFTFQSKSLAFLFDYFDSTLSCQSLSNFHSCWLLPVRQNCGSILGVSWSLRDKAFFFSRWSKDTSTNLVTLKITAWLRCKRKYALAAIRRFHPCVAHLLEFSVFFLWSFCP